MFITRLGRAIITDPLNEARPLLRQAVAQSKGLSPRLSLALAALMLILSALAALALSGSQFTIFDTRNIDIRLLFAMPLLRHLVFQVVSLWPYLATLAAAWLVDRGARSEPFALLRQTGISDRAVIIGYSLSSLYRMRLPLLILTLTPLLAVQPLGEATSKVTAELILNTTVTQVLEVGLALLWQVSLALMGVSLITALRLRLGRESQPVLVASVFVAGLAALLLLAAEWLKTPLSRGLFEMASLSTPFVRIGLRPIEVMAMAAAALIATRLTWQIGWRTPPASSRRIFELALAGLLLVSVPVLDDELLQLNRARYAAVLSLLSNGYTRIVSTGGSLYPGYGAAPRNVATIVSIESSGASSLRSLPPEIGLFTSLQTLHLRSNELSSLPPEIGQLTNLQSLDLSINELTRLPPEIGQLTDLQSLDLSFNKFTSLPPEIGQLTNLQSIDLSFNELTRLPPEIGQLSNLKSLDLTYSELTSLPPEIGQLTNLQTLRITRGRFSRLPPEIGKLTSLRTLDLPEGQLTSLPPEFGNLTNLRDLNLRFNHLGSLPSEIGQLSDLQSLNLDQSVLTSLPSTIGQLTNLQEMILGGNQLANLPPEIGRLTDLQTLDLSSNQLTSLPPEIGQLSNLREFNLSDNQLANVPPEIGLLTNLEVLNLDHNQLTTLPLEIGQLTKLRSFSLIDNELISLPSEIGLLSQLELLDVNFNPGFKLPDDVCAKLTQVEFHPRSLCP